MSQIIQKDSSSWPPAYTIKQHVRTKQVKLKISPKKGLELIVPTRFNLKHVPKILVENKKWIETQFLKLAQHELKNNETTLPEKIFLRAIHQTWHIHYIQSDIMLRIMPRPHQHITVVGNIQNKELCKKLLIHWLKDLAKIHLTHQLKKVSEQTQLPCNKITIRDQQTRWGSCTKEKNISLNYKLLFLPEHLASHIFIHELCHTIHLNHSDRFWKLVEKFDSNWQEHRAAIRKINEWIPEWVI